MLNALGEKDNSKSLWMTNYEGKNYCKQGYFVFYLIPTSYNKSLINGLYHIYYKVIELQFFFSCTQVFMR